MPWYLTTLRITPFYKAELQDFYTKHVFFDYSTQIAQVGANTYGLGSVKNHRLCARIERQMVCGDKEGDEPVECFVPVAKADMLYEKNSKGLACCELISRFIIVIGKEKTSSYAAQTPQ